jgi:presenilin-like A22 family membrane protease
MKYRQPKNIKEKIVQKQFWKIFLIEGGLFLITSLLALISAFKLNKLIKAKETYLPTTTLQDFLLSFIFITFFVLLFILFKNKKFNKFKEIVFKGIFILACFGGGMTILNLFLPVFASILIMGILIALWLKLKKVWVHDVLIILALAGMASFFGLEFSPSGVVVLLLIFSIYDFIAVYKTKHMVLMVKEMIDKKVVLGFIIPKELKYFKDGLDKVKPAGNFMILGGGDVVFPNLLAVSVIPFGFLKALIVVFFALTGLLFTYWIFVKEKEPIPALPPIAMLSIFGYLITLFL